MHLVYVIALLTALNQSKGLYTGPDGKVMMFETLNQCQSVVLSQGLDKINVLGTHGKCERRIADANGNFAGRAPGKHKH